MSKRRYIVSSRAAPSVAKAWTEYLVSHVPEVVVAGGFTGAEVVQAGDHVRCEYACDERSFDRYLAEEAPRLRAHSDAQFPEGIERQRSGEDISMRVSAAFAWQSLGLVDDMGNAVAPPTDGPFTLVYVAPWCPECGGAIQGLSRVVQAGKERAAFVVVFGSFGEARALVPRGARLWHEPSRKDEVSRLRTAHAWLAALAGEERRWGVPVVRQLFVKDGRFVVLAGAR